MRPHWPSIPHTIVALPEFVTIAPLENWFLTLDHLLSLLRQWYYQPSQLNFTPLECRDVKFTSSLAVSPPTLLPAAVYVQTLITNLPFPAPGKSFQPLRLPSEHHSPSALSATPSAFEVLAWPTTTVSPRHNSVYPSQTTHNRITPRLPRSPGRLCNQTVLPFAGVRRERGLSGLCLLNRHLDPGSQICLGCLEHRPQNEQHWSPST